MPAPAIALAAAALRNPRRTGRWLLILLALLGHLDRVPDRRDRLDHRHPTAAGRGGRPRRRSPTSPATTSSSTNRPAPNYGVDPWILAAIGKIETDHGRSTLPGIRFPTTNTHGCCAGPMQMCVIDGCPPSAPNA